MTDYPYNPRHNEPRQPESKGKTVYTSETPIGVVKAMIEEARASVALDGETQSFDKPFPSSVAVTHKPPKEETMTLSTEDQAALENEGFLPPRRGPLPYGFIRDSVKKSIREVDLDVPFELNGSLVFGWMEASRRTIWQDGFGTTAEILIRVNTCLADLISKTDFPIQKIEGSVPPAYTYLGEEQKVEKPVVASPAKKKARVKLPLGMQGDTVARIVDDNAKIGQHINAELVISWFSKDEYEKWRRAYGPSRKVVGKVRRALANLRYADRLNIEVTDTPATYIYRGPSEKPGKPKEPSKSETSALPISDRILKVAVPESDLDDYTRIGVDLSGDPLYFDALTKTVGTFVFTPVKP